MASSLPVTRIAFGIFTIDPRSGEFTKYGTRLRLQERPLKILLALLERPGQVVTRDELRSLLWPDGTHVDFDHNISSSVNKLRTALGDSATNPRFIETVGRRGYRFLYPVSIAEEPVAAVAQPRRLRYSSAWRVLTVAVLLMASAFGLIFVRRIENTSKVHSLVVIPLRNLSADSGDEYFSEGFTDELITRLANIQGLRVISLTSAIRYKNQGKSTQDIAKELGVDAVLEGSILRSDDKIRITARLLDGNTGRYLWAASYDSHQGAVLELQNEVTREIADNIRLELKPSTDKHPGASQEISPEAHEDYLRGRYFYSKRTAENLWTAVRYFQSAIVRDPGYARSYASLADCYTLLGGYSGLPQAEYIAKARAAALKAIELDGSLAEAHTSLALIAQNYDWEWATAEREYRLAIELDPNYSTAHHWYAEFLSYQGRFEEAFAQIEKARQLDPLSSIINTDFGVILYYSRRYDSSVERLNAVLRSDPGFLHAHMIIYPLVEEGRYDDAMKVLRTIQFSSKMSDIWKYATEAYIYGRSGKIVESKHFVVKLRMDAKDLDPAPLILACIGARENDQAIAELELAYKERSTAMTTLKVNPLYDPLRSDPRFQQLLQRLDFPP